MHEEENIPRAWMKNFSQGQKKCFTALWQHKTSELYFKLHPQRKLKQNGPFVSEMESQRSVNLLRGTLASLHLFKVFDFFVYFWFLSCMLILLSCLLFPSWTLGGTGEPDRWPPTESVIKTQNRASVPNCFLSYFHRGVDFFLFFFFHNTSYSSALLHWVLNNSAENI